MLRRHSVGDTKVPFCLQSCVKPLVYAIAVHDLGSEYTHRFVGKEPSGFRFNKLSLDEDGKCFESLTLVRGKKACCLVLKKLFHQLTFVTICCFMLPSEPSSAVLRVQFIT